MVSTSAFNVKPDACQLQPARPGFAAQSTFYPIYESLGTLLHARMQDYAAIERKEAHSDACQVKFPGEREFTYLTLISSDRRAEGGL